MGSAQLHQRRSQSISLPILYAALPPMFAAFSITDIPSGPAVLSRAYVSRVEQLLRQRQGKPPSLKQKEDYLQKAGIELVGGLRQSCDAITTCSTNFTHFRCLRDSGNLADSG